MSGAPPSRPSSREAIIMTASSWASDSWAVGTCVINVVGQWALPLVNSSQTSTATVCVVKVAQLWCDGQDTAQLKIARSVQIA